jgi:hypothetical protein
MSAQTPSMIEWLSIPSSIANHLVVSVFMTCIIDQYILATMPFQSLGMFANGNISKIIFLVLGDIGDRGSGKS